MTTASMNGHARPADLADPEAAATAAAATPAAADPESQRVGVHPGRPAGVQARGRARARARKTGAAAAAGLRHGEHHGPPWEEAPQSLKQLRESLHHRAATHGVVPFGKELYLAWAYAWILPATAVTYVWLWVAQSPVRTTVAAILFTVLRVTGVIPTIPPGLIAHVLSILL